MVVPLEMFLTIKASITKTYTFVNYFLNCIIAFFNNQGFKSQFRKEVRKVTCASYWFYNSFSILAFLVPSVN